MLIDRDIKFRSYLIYTHINIIAVTDIKSEKT